MEPKAWILSMLLHLSPVEHAELPQPLPEMAETVEQRRERYESIAADIAAVVYDPTVAPVYTGPYGRAQTAALVVAMAWGESGFARDVDLGPCAPRRVAAGGCDRGKSACMLQIKLGKRRTVEGWSQQDLFADRRKCLLVAVRALRSSFGQCRHLPEELRLTAYGKGNCKGEPLQESRPRIRLTHSLRGRFPQVTDAEVVRVLARKDDHDGEAAGGVEKAAPDGG